MQIALINDIHFGIRSDNKNVLNYQKKFFDNIFFPELIKNNIKTVLIGGDIFDRRKYINFVTLKETREMFFDVLKEMNIKVYCIAGNHDVYYKTTNEVNSIDLLLSGYDNFEFLYNPKTLDFDGCKIDMIPWINPENEKDIFKFINKSDSKILYGHLELSGFDMYRGSVCEHGMESSLFKKYDQVWSGHFHHKSSKGNIHYLGAPMEFTFADSEDARGFHIFNTEDNSLKFIKNKFTMYEKILYNDLIDKNNDFYLNGDVSQYADKQVKLFVIKKSKPAIFEMFVEKFFELENCKLIIHEDYSEFNGSKVNIEQIKSTTTKDLIEQYIDGIETEKDKPKLKNIINSIYVEALHQNSQDTL